MRVEDLIRCSLQKNQVEKLVVLLGFMDYGKQWARSAVACRVEEVLFKNCRPPLNDIHNPDRCRVAARDASGSARAYYDAHTRSLAASKRTRRSLAATALRKPQQWDSSPVMDYMGVWCDRLLLGEETRPCRAALLRPCVPPCFQPEAMQRVAHALPHLKASDVLLVDATPHLPFGSVRLLDWETLMQCSNLNWEGSLVQRRWRQMDSSVTERRIPSSTDSASSRLGHKDWTQEDRAVGSSGLAISCMPPLGGMGLSIEEVLQQLLAHRGMPSPGEKDADGEHHRAPPAHQWEQGEHRTTASSTVPASSRSPQVLVIGCGDIAPPLSRFSEEEEKYLSSMILPLSAFAVALWTISPSIASAYVAQQTARLPFSRVPSASSSSSLSSTIGGPPPTPSAKNSRQWRTMQCSMLSTRDTALLRAHFTKTRLDGRLSIHQQTYLAETLLRRLEDQENEQE